MFNVVTGRRKSRIFSPRVVAITAGAHLLVLVAFVSAAAKTASPRMVITEIALAPPTEPKPVPPAPKLVQPDQPKPTIGETLVLRPPPTPPPFIPPVDPTATPTHPQDYSGLGVPGDSIDHSVPTPQPPAGDGEPQAPRDWRDGVSTPDEVDVLPELTSPRDAARMLERVYPPVLRDAGVTGHTTVQLIIDRNGNVEPGSISVQESTNDAFRDAAIRAAEKFRFRPARLHGQPVSVIISLPIDWRIQN